MIILLVEDKTTMLLSIHLHMINRHVDDFFFTLSHPHGSGEITLICHVCCVSLPRNRMVLNS